MAPMVIGTNPIIQAVTSSSSLLQNSTVSVAPYDMISVFGTNFCPNCTSTQVLTGSPDVVTSTYPTQLQFNSTTKLPQRNFPGRILARYRVCRSMRRCCLPPTRRLI